MNITEHEQLYLATYDAIKNARDNDINIEQMKRMIEVLYHVDIGSIIPMPDVFFESDDEELKKEMRNSQLLRAETEELLEEKKNFKN